MNPTARSLCALALLTPALALASGSVELRVTGTIKPGACTPSIEGSIDYGTLPSVWVNLDVNFSGPKPDATPPAAIAANTTSGVKRNTRTLDKRRVLLNINCTAAMPVAILVRDNKPGSKVLGLAEQASPNATEDSMFSLDATQDNKHGAFHLAMRKANADNTELELISSPLSGTPAWSSNKSGSMSSDRLLSWAYPGTLTPASWRNLTGVLEVTPVLNGDIDRTQDLKLNGSATIEIRYL